MRHINLPVDEWTESLRAYGEIVGSATERRSENWDAVVAAVKTARAAGVPWERLILPSARYASSSSSSYPYSSRSNIIESLDWSVQSNSYSGAKKHYRWPLEQAFYRSAKAARALITMGAPLQSLLAATAMCEEERALANLEPLAFKKRLLDLASENGRFYIGGRRVVGGMSVIALALSTLGKGLPEEERLAFAKNVLDWARKEKEGLWLNKAGCLPAEVNAAKTALWAQEIAQEVWPLQEVDPVWAQDAEKIVAKAKASGSGKAAQAARDAEQLPEKQLRRWAMIGTSLIHDDLEAWMAMESLAGLDNAKGLNLPMSKYRGSDSTGSLWITHAINKRAFSIASRMLLNGANPWLLGPEVFAAKSQDVKSPVAAVVQFGQSGIDGAKWATLGEALCVAMMRDAKAVEPSEEAARAIVRQELDDRLGRPGIPEALRSAIENWSLSVHLGIKGLDGQSIHEADSAATTAPRRARSRL